MYKITINHDYGDKQGVSSVLKGKVITVSHSYPQIANTTFCYPTSWLGHSLPSIC